MPTRGKKGEVLEDNLDCPLVDLEFIRQVSERSDAKTAKREPVYSFNYEDKRDVTDSLFAYCLNEYWENSVHSGDTLPFRSITASTDSPGQVFKLPELAVRDRLERLSKVTEGALEFVESSTIQQVVRKREFPQTTAFDNIYLGNL